MNSLAKVEPENPFTQKQISLIKNTVAKGATDEELKLFLYVAGKRRLDPLARQIYFQKHRNAKTGKDDITFITSIDGYRLTADRTGKYAGNDDPVFDDDENPRVATVTVYKVVGGIRCPFTAKARWNQYYPGDLKGFMWRKMPHLMLGKCAEALALRKAFPEELGGIYVKEEMDQAGADTHEEAKTDGEVVDASYYDETEPFERYTGADHQKKVLFSIAVDAGIAANDGPYLKALHEEFQKGKGIEMQHLEAGVREYMSEHPYAAHA